MSFHIVSWLAKSLYIILNVQTMSAFSSFVISFEDENVMVFPLLHFVNMKFNSVNTSHLCFKHI